MPYLLKEYFSGATLAASSHVPESAEAVAQFAQFGWSPQAARLPLVEGGVYRLDDPRQPGRHRRVRVDRVGLESNGITYTVEGEACGCCCRQQPADMVEA